MATVTLGDIAKWPKPNYENPVTLAPVVYGLNIPLVVIMTGFVAGRFWSRTVIVRNALAADDWTMLVSYVLCLAIVICHIVELDVGIGRHLYDVKTEWLEMIGKMTLVTQAMFAPAAALTKISICLTYLRLFPSRTNKWFNYISIAVLALWGIATTLAMCLQCLPLRDVWAVFKPQSQKKCINTEIFFIATAAINALTDIFVYLWPIHYLWAVHLSLVKRIGLIICFGLGVVICIAGMVRIWILVRFFDSWDQTWNGGIVYIIVTVETSLGIICGCLPGLRPLMTKLFPRVFNSTHNASSKGGNGANSNTIGGGNNSSGRARGTGLSSAGLSSLKSGLGNSGYRDLESIHVTKDIELSVTTAEKYHIPRVVSVSGGKGNGGSRTATRHGSEEWIFKPETGTVGR